MVLKLAEARILEEVIYVSSLHNWKSSHEDPTYDWLHLCFMNDDNVSHLRFTVVVQFGKSAYDALWLFSFS